MECCICLENLKELIKIVTPCRHEMCIHCFIALTDYKCPLCRFYLKKYIPDKLLKKQPEYDIQDADQFPSLSG